MQEVEEYKESNTFETDNVAATSGAYNLKFGVCKKVVNAFLNLNLHLVTPTGEPKEDEEKVG